MDITAAQRVQGQAEWLPAGVQVVFHHLGEAPWSWSPSVSLLCCPSSIPLSLDTNLSPPDQLVTLVPVGFIDFHKRVRLAEQILETQGKWPMNLARSTRKAGERSGSEEDPWSPGYAFHGRPKAL